MYYIHVQKMGAQLTGEEVGQEKNKATHMCRVRQTRLEETESD